LGTRVSAILSNFKPGAGIIEKEKEQRKEERCKKHGGELSLKEIHGELFIFQKSIQQNDGSYPFQVLMAII